MPRILIVVICVIALMCGGAAFVYTGWQYMVAAAEESIDEATEFSKTATQTDCLEEVAQRTIGCSGIVCQLKTKTFIRACMQNASLGENICAYVPHYTDMIEGIGWAQATCGKFGVTDENCSSIIYDALFECGSES